MSNSAQCYTRTAQVLLQDNPELLAIVKPMHIYLSWFAGLLIAGHILAAIKHHVIDKDNVLLSMLRQPKYNNSHKKTASRGFFKLKSF